MHNIGLFKNERTAPNGTVGGSFQHLEALEDLEEDDDRSSSFMQEKPSNLYEERRSNFQRENFAAMESTITTHKKKESVKDINNPIGGLTAKIDETSHPMIFGGLNTEKMNEFILYFPYNNCKEVIEFVNFQSRSRRKSTRNIQKMENTNQKTKLQATNQKGMVSGLIHFKNLQRIFFRSIVDRNKRKEKGVIKKLFNRYIHAK